MPLLPESARNRPQLPPRLRCRSPSSNHRNSTINHILLSMQHGNRPHRLPRETGETGLSWRPSSEALATARMLWPRYELCRDASNMWQLTNPAICLSDDRSPNTREARARQEVH